MRTLAPFPLFRHNLLVSASIVALVAAGCAETRDLHEPQSVPIEAQRLHPISADIQRATFEISEAHTIDIASSSTYFDVTRFVRHYRRDGRGALAIAVPRKPSARAQRNLTALRRIAAQNGVSAQRIVVGERSDGAGTITMSFSRIAAVAPEHCNHWNENVIKRVETRPMPIFGCASQRNLANMVADPTDLVTPQIEEPRGSERRAATSKAYRETGGPAPSLAK
jgi:pilus assembly protein CpaD